MTLFIKLNRYYFMSQLLNFIKPPKYCYHIYKKFGESNDFYLAWWPITGYDGYCSDLKIAEKAAS